MATLAVLIGLTTSAFAEDFNKTGASITAEGEKFGVSLSTGATRDFADNARTLGIYTTSNPVNFGLQYIENGDVTDYRLNTSIRKDLQLANLNVYGVAEAHYDMGDSFTKNELRLSPYAGVELTDVGFTPFAELGYDWKSNSSDYLNLDKADSYGKAGIRVPVTENTTITVSMLQKMDTDFKKTDREAQVGFKVKF